MQITDCHIHINPLEMLSPGAAAVLKKTQPHFERIARYSRSPREFLKYLDEAGVYRAGLVNYVSPDVTGFTTEVNPWIANYCKEDPKRLLACGSLHPRYASNFAADLDELLRLGIRMIKIHPPHQWFFPNDYLNGMRELELLYRAAEQHGIPVMIHTGTSIFPGARNRYGDPIHLDDVAVDFPKLKIIMAHGGRPLWMDTAFFLVRRHRNVFLDISSIPPRSLLQYFPRLESIAGQTLFGTDWPGPGVPSVKGNLDDFRALPLSPEAQEKILSTTALAIWPE
jgi:hypothetical protein